MRNLVFWATLWVMAVSWAAQAQRMNTVEGGHFQARVSNPSPEAQRTILMELLSDSTPALSWPAFPRTWTQLSESTYQETSTSLGLTVNAIANRLGLGFLSTVADAGVNYKPYNFAYRYTFETTLIAMTSYRGQVADPNAVIPAPEDELHTIFKYDPQLNRNFFKANKQNPMIGFCAIEARLEVNVSEEFGITYVIGETRSATGKTRTIKHALYSNFFQIEPHIPVSEYLETYCGGEFRKNARPYVEADFNKLVLETNIHNNPKNECVIEDQNDPQGDNGCMAWFANVDRVVQKVTVPRCVVTRSGVSRCQLRAKPKMNCPLYLDRKTNQYTSDFKLYADATSGFSFTCDEGLTCRMEREPARVGSLIFWPGRATCQ